MELPYTRRPIWAATGAAPRYDKVRLTEPSVRGGSAKMRCRRGVGRWASGNLPDIAGDAIPSRPASPSEACQYVSREGRAPRLQNTSRYGEGRRVRAEPYGVYQRVKGTHKGEGRRGHGRGRKGARITRWVRGGHEEGTRRAGGSRKLAENRLDDEETTQRVKEGGQRVSHG